MPSQAESPGFASLRERGSSGFEAVGLQVVALSLRTLDQHVELDVTQSPAHACEIAQVRPQQLLAVKSERERLQLEKTAERRVLQPPDGGAVEPFVAEAAHQREQVERLLERDLPDLPGGGV